LDNRRTVSLLEEDARERRLRDALAERLHREHDEIPQPKAVNGIDALEAEIRHAMDEISGYLMALDELRHAKALFSALSDPYDPKDRTEYYFVLRPELERVDARVEELIGKVRDMEPGATPTLRRLAALVITRGRLSSGEAAED